MPNPNIVPRPENLTRAGMGQPPKGLQRVQVTLSPQLIEKLDAVTSKQGWKRNYLIEQTLRAIAGLSSDYSLFELEQIFAGREEFQDI
jgi:hypothetical protein